MAIQNDQSSTRGTRVRRPRRGLPTRFESLEGRLLLAGDPPVAVADTYTTPVGAELNIAAAGLLANDTDAEGDALTAIGVSEPTNGVLTLNADGSFKYTPNQGFRGTDSFTYKANDGTTDSNSATVTITVNSAPAVTADSYTATQGTALTVPAPGLLSNDTDGDGDTLTTSLEDGPQHGNLTLNTDGSFTYTPNAGYTGADSFTYKASDGLATSAPATVSLTINAATNNRLPTSVADTYRTGINTPLTIPASSGVLANDSDPDSDPLTASLVSQPSNGTVTLNLDGSFTYTPTTAFRGTDIFTYKANDGKADGSTTTVTIQVNNVPTAANDAYTTTNASTLNISVPGVLSNDTDPNGDTLSAVLISPTTNGTLSLNANGSFTYTANAGFVGTDTFIYQASDGLNTSTSATVTISVTSSANTAPVAVNNSYTTVQGQAIQVNATNGVLGNDTDANGDPLTAVLVTGPTFGTLTLNPNGSFTYTPKPGFTGTDAFTYKASDSKTQSALATALLYVNAPDDGGEDTITGTGSSGNDNGVPGDGQTTNTRPSFTGIAPAGFVVKLFAQKAGAESATQVGQVTAGSDGRYTVVSTALGEGTYAFRATATDPASTSGTPAASVALGSLTISASAPRVSAVTIAPASGKVVITFTTPLNGADPTAILAATNFSVTRGGRRVAITKVELTSPTEITLTLRGGRKIQPGSLRLLAGAENLKDASGRELDGEFTRSLPSGDGVAGGNFLARLTLTRKGQTIRPVKVRR